MIHISLTKEELQSMIEASISKILEKHQLSHLTEKKYSPDPNELFTVKQAAKFLGVAVQTMYAYSSQKKIHSIKKTKKLYFFRSDLEKWLLEGRRHTKDEIADQIHTVLKSKIKK